MIRIITAAALLSAVSAAHASVQFFPDFSAEQLNEVSGTQFEARFKADRFNWDSRLEYDGFPTNGDNTANVTNNVGQLSSRTYAFDLSHDATAGVVTWSITDTTSMNTTTLTLDTIDGTVANTIKIFTNGSRAETTVTDLSFNGLGASLTDADFPSLDTNPGGPTFLQTLAFFGNGADLYAGDWTLAGNVAFRNFTNNNPNEGAKITVKVQQGNLVPTPGAIALVAASGLFGVRRRR